jgi:hypothetical protein
MVAAPLSVRPVESASDREDFLRFPERLYRHDPAWIAPLRIERREQIDPRRNPWFEHGEARFWLARRGGRAVGRISAQVDRLRLERHRDATGQFGMIEAEDDAEAFAALFAAAESWLGSHGMTRANGPFNLSINDECGLLVSGFEHPPAMMMGHAPPHYAAHLERLGYRKAKDLLAYDLVIERELSQQFQAILKRGTTSRPITVRPMRRERYQDEVRVLVDIFNDAWSDNWGFVPFTEAEVAHFARNLKFLIRPELVAIAEIDGCPEGVFVVLPDLNEAIRDLGGRLLPLGWARLLWRLKAKRIKSFRVPLLGVRRRHRGTYEAAVIISHMYTAIHTALRRGGFRRGELSWVLEDNKPMRRMIELSGGTVRKTYRIYEKELG